MIDTDTIEKLERIAGNLPVQSLDYVKVPTKWGLIYIAIGRGPGELSPISWLGVYGIRYGGSKMIAQIGEVRGDLPKNTALEEFVKQAAFNYSIMEPRDMLDESYSLG